MSKECKNEKSTTKAKIKFHSYFPLDHDKWPTFADIDCSTATKDKKYTKCFKVNYPGDKQTDYMLMEEIENAFKTYRGIMKDERAGTVPVVFNLPDTEDGETEAGVSIFG